jgi:curved DNA-binding protein
VRLAKDPGFERRGDDLYFDQPLDVITAILGGKISIKSFDKTVSMGIPAGTDSNKIFRLKGMGMPVFENPTTRGDAYVRMILRIPKDLNEEEKELLLKFETLRKKTAN